MYEVKVIGQYFAGVAHQKEIKEYEFTLPMDESAKKIGFLSVIKTYFLRERPGKPFYPRIKYPDWKHYYTYAIDSVVDTSKNRTLTELGLMNRAQVLSYINASGIPIDAYLYPDLPQLRQALRDYKDNPTAFLKAQEARTKSHGPSLKTQQTFEEAMAKYFSPEGELEREKSRKARLRNLPSDVAPRGAKPEIDDFSLQDSLSDLGI